MVRPMTTPDQERPEGGGAWPRCECGYTCQGESEEDRVRDAQRHARDVHQIDVTAAQVVAECAP